MLTELAHLAGISQVLSGSMAATAVVAMTVRLSSSSSGAGGGHPHPRRPVLTSSCGCPPGMCVEPPIPHVVFAPPIFAPELKV
jgi:hypothetical protein